MLTISQFTPPLHPDSMIRVDGQWYRVATLIEGSRREVRSKIWDTSGEHDYSDGVFIISGGPVKRNIRDYVQASIYDITPTMLYLAGLPAAKDMPGRVLLDLFTPEYVKKNPPSLIETYEDNTQSPEHGEENKADADDGALIEQLRAIGYLP